MHLRAHLVERCTPSSSLKKSQNFGKVSLLYVRKARFSSRWGEIKIVNKDAGFVSGR